MTDDTNRHRWLANNLAARLRAEQTQHLEQLLVDRVLASLEGVRERDSFGRRWERRIAAGPGDVDPCWHLVRPASLGFELVRTACNGAWNATDATDADDSPPLEDRCLACWRAAVAGNALALALIDELDAVIAEERAKVGAREAARDELLPRRTLTADARRRLDERRDRAVAEAIATAPHLYAPRLHPAVTIGLPCDDLGTPIVVDAPGESGGG